MSTKKQRKANLADNDLMAAKPSESAMTSESAAATSEPFTWQKNEAPGPQSRSLGRRLASTGELFRWGDEQIVQLRPGCKPRILNTPITLEGFIRSRFEVRVFKNGKLADSRVPATDLNIFLSCPELHSDLPAVDHVTDVVAFSSSWETTRPGYNDGPEGERLFYAGDVVNPKTKPTRIRQFLKVMHFKGEADATNAVALALTTLLRFRWKGKKPFGAITANKSHAGKDTIVDFCSGRTMRQEISWHKNDWACQNEAVAVLADRNVGVLTLGNIRSDSSIIESSFIERIVTSPRARMQSSKRRGDGYEREGDYVVMATANNGRFSPDLANRSLPIVLEQIGDIADRTSSIGDPRHEFLPAHREEIEAELCGMIANWKKAGCPLDKTVAHPMKEWAQTIGGILKVNGFENFLGNWTYQRSVNDSLRENLAIIANASSAGEWLRVRTIAETAATEGVTHALMDAKHRSTNRAIERQLGVILSSHRDETVHLETDEGIKSFVIRKDRNSATGQLATVYRFEPVPTSSSKTSES